MEHEQSDKTSSKKVGGGFSLVAIGVTSTAWVAYSASRNTRRR